jgi:uncharacterized protein (TIGR03492 family)
MAEGQTGIQAMKMMIASNGYGEDTIGAAIAKELKKQGFEVSALPIVGAGLAYEEQGITTVGPKKTMPSGGFVFDRPGAFRRDIRSGFIQMTLTQWQTLRHKSRDIQATLVVGDWYALSVARFFSRGPIFQMQPLVSLHYWQGEGAPIRGQPYGLWERTLMKTVKRVYPRDEATALWLRQHGIKQAHCLGNPMLDALYGDEPLDIPAPYLLLMPGSRADAYESLPIMLEACYLLRDLSLTPVMAWTGLPFKGNLLSWNLTATGMPEGITHRFEREGCVVYVIQKRFASLLKHAKLSLSTSGTAAEQAAAYGVPLIGFPTAGPQYTLAFAQGQRRLLREALTLSEANSEKIAQTARALINDSRRYGMAKDAAKTVMGEPGAAQRIAKDIHYYLQGDHDV